MATSQRMADLVVKVCDLFEKDRARTGIKDRRPKMFPPAALHAIRAFEKKIARQFPPSYVEFLKVTNGVLEYQRSFTLIGVSGEHTEEALADINKRRTHYTAEWEKEHGKATEAAIETFEKKMDFSKKTEGEAHIYPGNKFAFGTDLLGSLFYFLDPGPKEDSEGRVVWRDNLARLVVYDNFRAMLERNITVLSKRLGIEV